MDVFDAITTRTSITKYKDKGVPREEVARILEAARFAPSAGNMQTWEFIVVEDDEKKERMAQFAQNQPHVREAPVVIVVLSDIEKAERRYGERGREMYAIQETAAAMQNMLLEAHNLNLGAAWVGAFDEEAVRDMLGIPQRSRPVAIVTVGHPAEKPEQPSKFDLSNMVYINRYGERVTPLYDKFVWQGVQQYGDRVRKGLSNIRDKYT